MPCPLSTHGFAFVEFASPQPKAIKEQFLRMGFAEIGTHKTQPVTLYRQGDIYFVLNETLQGFAADFAAMHGPAACAAGFFVDGDLENAGAPSNPGFLNAPCREIPAIGDSRIYLIDAKHRRQLFDGFNWKDGAQSHGVGLKAIDHLSYNVKQGSLQNWSQFYQDRFGFREIRYFHIKGKQTALRSRALVSACGKIRITINESDDDQSQIAEFIKVYKGEGIQHIALNPNDIYQSVEQLNERGVSFIEVPKTYYDALSDRLPEHREDVERMRRNYILLDGVSDKNEMLLQIVTPPVLGPLFFEIIERKGCDGFGEGNFTALFEALERDQVARGILDAA